MTIRERQPDGDPRATLATISSGTKAAIVEVGGERVFRRRLMELGFVPGAEVRLIRVAPLGDPLEVEVRGCRISIRRAEASCIVVSRG